MLDLVKKIANNEFVRGGFYFTMASTLVNVLNYLFNFISARVLGPDGLGEISTFSSYLSILAVPTTVVSSFIIQKIASSQAKKIDYASALLGFFWRKVKDWWFVFALFLGISFFIPKITNLSFYAGIAVIPSIIILLASSYYQAIFQGLNLLVATGNLGVLSVLIKLAGPILILLKLGTIDTIILFLVLSLLIPLLISHLKLQLIFNEKGTDPAPKWEKKISSLIYNRQFLLILSSSLALNLLSNFDIVFVKKYFTAQETGIYSSWSLLAKIILYGVGPLISVSFIFFSGQKEKSNQVFKISLIFLSLIGLISYCFYTFFAHFVIDLFFGKKFIAVLPYLSSASIFGSLYAALSFVNSYYLAKKSKVALILPILIPVYIVLLFYVDKNLTNIIYLNIYFSLSALLLHLIVHLKQQLNLNPKSSH